MFVQTLYVRPNMKAHFVRQKLNILEDKVYKVYDTWYKENAVFFGLVGGDSKIVYCPSDCMFILDSKTKKLAGGNVEED